jgi:hypothetical protein
VFGTCCSLSRPAGGKALTMVVLTDWLADGWLAMRQLSAADRDSRLAHPIRAKHSRLWK